MFKAGFEIILKALIIVFITLVYSPLNVFIVFYIYFSLMFFSYSPISSGQSRSQLAKSCRPLSLSSSVDVPHCPSEVKPRSWV